MTVACLPSSVAPAMVSYPRNSPVCPGRDPPGQWPTLQAETVGAAVRVARGPGRTGPSSLDAPCRVAFRHDGRGRVDPAPGIVCVPPVSRVWLAR